MAVYTDSRGAVHELDADGRNEFDRYVCRPSAPWSLDKGRASHPDAVKDSQTGVYQCPWCSAEFKVEP